MKIALPGFLSSGFTRGIAAIALIVTLTGCSSFDRQYEAALARPVASDSPVGPWVGHWKSNKNGHNGELLCVVEKSVDDTYIAKFKARFWKCFTYTSTADLTMIKGDGEYSFSGDADLGWLAGGIYEYEGRVTRRYFFSEYECKWDYGTFYLERPKH